MGRETECVSEWVAAHDGLSGAPLNGEMGRERESERGGTKRE